MAKAKRVQKTVYFDAEVWEALEKQMKVSHNPNVSAIVNDGLRYAMFPEHRNDRDADLVKLYNQFSASLAMHRKKTARDLAFMQELILKFSHEFFMHHPSIPEDSKAPREAEANARLDAFMENIVRNMSELKPLSDREEV
ncbi:MAG: hypothetical protein CMH27_06700 [Micavibrio sp.]|jgi:hypothetical protein|nr:hypothetical protein [Micavibrio sp.]|tara:strand:+ start:391 stop:810 length:420 start_codon:yes stop_codon:yes gene_type:complete